MNEDVNLEYALQRAGSEAAERLDTVINNVKQ